jgi:hypothetical protein
LGKDGNIHKKDRLFLSCERRTWIPLAKVAFALGIRRARCDATPLVASYLAEGNARGLMAYGTSSAKNLSAGTPVHGHCPNDRKLRLFTFSESTEFLIRKADSSIPTFYTETPRAFKTAQI